eukprot:CAMPEP_0194546818 /NCGR_PEP_ID=MMETSP0253-20130528/91232_1 /TAXON_ID=2966 /ORGANISM="Noctiluca scintillans" /LENGTH=41 /DNA_ID= /DNA_START= /DNA_END= /DNA_ORIENTATION=
MVFTISTGAMLSSGLPQHSTGMSSAPMVSQVSCSLRASNCR